MQRTTRFTRSWLARCAAIALVASAVDCRCDPGNARDPVVEKAAFGELPASDAGPFDLAPFLSLARAVVEHKPPPETPSAPGRRAVVTLYRTKGGRAVGSASRDALRDAVTAAAEAASHELQGPPDTIQLDVVTSIEPTRLDADLTTTLVDLGLSGYAATDGAPHFGFLLPSEIIYDRPFDAGKKTRIQRDKVLGPLATRAGVTTDAASAMHGYRFRTQAAVESTPPGRALPVLRGAPQRNAEVTPDSLLDSLRLGADYLSRVIDSSGKYTYLYHPLDDKNDASYGILRHSGATYALLEAYDELKTPLYLEKASLALAYLTGRLRWSADPTGRMAYVVDNDDEEQQKVGGAGLALIAFAKRAQTTHTTDQIETMRGLGRLIVHQQYEDGHFRNNQDVEHEDPKAGPLKQEVLYFPGEAILGLLRLYAVDPDPRWLEAATKGADFCVFKRDAGKSDETQDHDHWLSYDLNELYKLTKKDEYAKHAFKIARAMDKKFHRADAPAPDMVGSFFDDGQSTLAATRLEAYDADIQLARAQGTSEAPLVDRAKEMGRFIQSEQFDGQAIYFLPNPNKSLGGVRESLFVYDVRIDYVQHAMSAWLHLARILRDPRYGAL